LDAHDVQFGSGDHEADVIITLAAAYRRETPAAKAPLGVLRPARAPKSKSDPCKNAVERSGCLVMKNPARGGHSSKIDSWR